ncbi:NAD(P)-binding domain-containing protein [Aeromicrobium fastidiosum]|uniref:SidA/IucD/PvdA family monooxygenase n=1 Tax=Aeromicrobium fastidiosum TaxID=52699 RepID=A0A641AP12_9ACTN|nr:NAD(P)-binding domain-containing protein [Aeromicrobium fastidiosum]KAA1379679.1 SidA/IucD/PvdA family monooxygenase [Aeromicrobium fastidiosum]MBP2389156.1 thioredoxin reductase [Aeromicrobium fastidiosum]
MTDTTELPVVVIGAGPSGLAAAANLHRRGIPALVLEAGDVAGAAVREWAHIRLFSPWSELVDPEAAKVLADAGWEVPNPKRYPTGGNWAADYLQPLADALGTVRFGHTVTGVAKCGRDLVVDSGREDAAFTLHVTSAEGDRHIAARAVIDASGTWSGPNPLGGDGLPAAGENAHADRIVHRVPDLTDAATAARYAGKHVAIAGTGASAKTALITFTNLAREHRGTRISWLVRRPTIGTAFGGGQDDELSERGALGDHAKAAVTGGPTTTFTGFRTAGIEAHGENRLRLTSFDGQTLDDVDEVVVLTGFRPDLGFLSEVRLDLDPVLQAPRTLAPLIDPNVHSCGTVYPHGAAELAQPEHGFYLVGMKSYGRATSFLALTGFEQVRSVVAEIAGDHAAAARVDLALPESGVCGGSGDFDEPEAAAGGCCGPADQTAVIPVP